MSNGYFTLMPIQGAIVAAVFLVIAVVKNYRGIKGKDALKWNAIGILCFLYLFTSATWIAMGSPEA